MSASAILGYALVGIDDQSGVIAAVITTAGLIVVAVINNMSESRRHKRELRYRNGGRGGSGVNTVLLVGMLISIGGLIYFTQRPDEESQASAGPAPPTAVVVDTTAAPTTSAVSGCAAFTVQIAAIKDDAPAIGEFRSQAQVLAATLPELGELHSADGDACGAEGRTQFYFGPFADADATRDACFNIGQVLHDNAATFTTFQSQGQIVYPYYRVEPGVSVRGSDGETLLCSPSDT